ncbi:hypothetical protein ACH196_10125 [Mesorhizobium sp. IMUNJ23232]
MGEFLFDHVIFSIATAAFLLSPKEQMTEFELAFFTRAILCRGFERRERGSTHPPRLTSQPFAFEPCLAVSAPPVAARWSLSHKLASPVCGGFCVAQIRFPFPKFWDFRKLKT